MARRYFQKFWRTGLVFENKIVYFVFEVSLSLFVIYLPAALLAIINLLASKK